MKTHRTSFNIFVLFAISVCFTACANMEPIATPTGKPEVMIASKDASRIKGAIVSTVSAQGFSIVQDTSYSLVFTKPMEGSGGFLYQAAMGNAYSSPPQWVVSFTIAPLENSTRVFAHLSVGMQGAFGQSQGANMDQGKAAHEAQAMLEQIKAEVERGG